jgi:hypothetical protein
MTKSSIEITDNAYLIRLSKAEFEYPLVRKLLNRLLSGKLNYEEDDVSDVDAAKRYSSDLGERFDFLADK